MASSVFDDSSHSWLTLQAGHQLETTYGARKALLAALVFRREGSKDKEERYVGFYWLVDSTAVVAEAEVRKKKTSYEVWDGSTEATDPFPQVQAHQRYQVNHFEGLLEGQPEPVALVHASGDSFGPLPQYALFARFQDPEDEWGAKVWVLFDPSGAPWAAVNTP